MYLMLLLVFVDATQTMAMREKQVRIILNHEEYSAMIGYVCNYHTQEENVPIRTRTRIIGSDK